MKNNAERPERSMVDIFEKALSTNPPATAPEIVRGELFRQTATTAIEQAAKEANHLAGVVVDKAGGEVRQVVGKISEETRAVLDLAARDLGNAVRSGATNVEASVKDTIDRGAEHTRTVLLVGSAQVRGLLWLAAGLWFGGSIVLELVRLACRYAAGLL